MDVMGIVEKGISRRHTFFTKDKSSHEGQSNFISAIPKQIQVFDKVINGWIITAEEPVIDKIISLSESMQAQIPLLDQE
jgi:hypothetical protein